MRMKPEHFERLKEILAFNPTEAQAKTLVDGYKRQGLSPKRLRWDILWAARRQRPGDFNKWFTIFYDYGDDTHVDTALRYLVVDNDWTVQRPVRKMRPPRQH